MLRFRLFTAWVAYACATLPPPAAARAAPDTQASAGPVTLQLRGMIQYDARDFDGGAAGSDDSLVRRARPTLDVDIGERISLRLTPDLASDPPRWVDAWLDVHMAEGQLLRVGRMKSPIGYERLVSSTALPLMERSFPSELAPNREVGVLWMGEHVDRGLSYSLGVVNGAADARNAPSRGGYDDVELQGRIAREWTLPGGTARFGIGFAAGRGQAQGSSALPRYRSPGQNTLFSYRPGAAATGTRTRLAPHAWLWRGPFGAIAEWSQTRQGVSATEVNGDVRHRAWQLTGIWVLSGEPVGFKGIETPEHALGDGGWGAWQVAARVAALDLDDAAFGPFADPARSATQARSGGVALSWQPTRHVRWMLDWHRTRFDGGASGRDRADERVWATRLQFTF
jgi:phosphate-selective porin OprO/OprP